MIGVFKAFDISGDGFIGEFELGQMLAQMGQVVDENDLSEIIRKVDRNGDGKLGECSQGSAHEQHIRDPNSCLSPLTPSYQNKQTTASSPG
mmetsp:Transcript_49511/g.140268  ORF Transcript_49511/g.140268 Transcript_49511/m.140268 type:complete len:91 (-) Transcript_49511:29-301(-)